MDKMCGRPEISDEVAAADLAGFLAWLGARRYSAATLELFCRSMSRFRVFLAGRSVVRCQDVTRSLLDDYRSSLVGAGLAAATVAGHLYCVRRFFAWLEARGLVFENPARSLRLPARVRQLPRVLSVAQVRRLLRAPDLTRVLGVRDRAILELLYSTGMRRGEMIALALGDVDLDAATVRVLGKDRKERLLPLGRHAARYLGQYLGKGRALLAKRNPDPDLTALWISRRGVPFTNHTLMQLFKSYVRRARLPAWVSLHTMRRSCATHLLANGAHPLLVARMLGHADLTSLTHYLRVSAAELKRAHRGSKPGR